MDWNDMDRDWSSDDCNNDNFIAEQAVEKPLILKRKQEKLKLINGMKQQAFSELIKKPPKYGMLKMGLSERKQRFYDFKKHAKVLLMTNGKDYYCIEGSSNWTSNPRIEQYVLCNNKQVFDFHKNWIMEILDKHYGKEN